MNLKLDQLDQVQRTIRLNSDRPQGMLYLAIALFVLIPLLGAAMRWPRAVVAALAIGGGSVALFRHIVASRRPFTPAFLEVLRDRPEQIVWAYRARGNAGSSLHLGLRSGKRLIVWTEDRDCTPMLEAVADRAPDAVIGYSDRRRRAFNRDPTRLADD